MDSLCYPYYIGIIQVYIKSAFGVINSGTGYSIADGQATTGGTGHGCTLNVTELRNGIVTGVSLVNPGTTYSVGSGTGPITFAPERKAVWIICSADLSIMR